MRALPCFCTCWFALSGWVSVWWFPGKEQGHSVWRTDQHPEGQQGEATFPNKAFWNIMGVIITFIKKWHCFQSMFKLLKLLLHCLSV